MYMGLKTKTSKHFKINFFSLHTFMLKKEKCITGAFQRWSWAHIMIHTMILCRGYSVHYCLSSFVLMNVVLLEKNGAHGSEQ